MRENYKKGKNMYYSLNYDYVKIYTSIDDVLEALTNKLDLPTDLLKSTILNATNEDKSVLDKIITLGGESDSEIEIDKSDIEKELYSQKYQRETDYYKNLVEIYEESFKNVEVLIKWWYDEGGRKYQDSDNPALKDITLKIKNLLGIKS